MHQGAVYGTIKLSRTGKNLMIILPTSKERKEGAGKKKMNVSINGEAQTHAHLHLNNGDRRSFPPPLQCSLTSSSSTPRQSLFFSLSSFFLLSTTSYAKLEKNKSSIINMNNLIHINTVSTWTDSSHRSTMDPVKTSPPSKNVSRNYPSEIKKRRPRSLETDSPRILCLLLAFSSPGTFTVCIHADTIHPPGTYIQAQQECARGALGCDIDAALTHTSLPAP